MLLRVPHSRLSPVLALATSVLACSVSLAQVEEVWAARYGSTVRGRDQANAVAVDDRGNVYVTGNASTRQATVKYGPEGQQLWAATYVPEANWLDCPFGLVVDGRGDVYVRCIGGPYAIIKYGPEGREIWTPRHEDLGVTDIADLVVDRQDNLYVIGESFRG